MSFDRVETAAAVRDAMKQIADDAVQRGAPKPNFGRVISVNFTALTAMVWFPGDNAPVSVNLFSSTMPGDWQDRYKNFPNVKNTSYVGMGSIVAVESFNGNLYVTHVLNGGQFATDFVTAGLQFEQYDDYANPGDKGGADYQFSVGWPTYSDVQQTQPNFLGNGGPYALNIGPMLYNGGQPYASGTFEVEVSLIGGITKHYKFNFDTLNQFTANNFGSMYDRWWRVLAERIDNQDPFQVGRTLNWYTTIDFTNGLGDWIAGTNTSVTIALTPNNGNTLGCLKMQSTNAAQAVIQAQVSNSNHCKVIGGAAYTAQFNVQSTATWTDVRFAVDWYDSSGVFISTSLPTAGSITSANVWQFMTFGGITAPSNAASCIPKLRVGSTPPTSQIFYFDNYAMNGADQGLASDFDLDLAFRTTQHGDPNGDSTRSNGELWMRVYIHWLDSLGLPRFTFRIKNSFNWTSIKSLYTKKPVYEYVTSNVPLPVGFLGWHDAFAGYTSNTTQYNANQDNVWTSGPWRSPDLTVAYRAQKVLSGGGMITWDGTNFKWSAPFEVGAIGRSRTGPGSGVQLLTMPTSGNIPVFPKGTTVTATSSGIPLATGQSLWFGIPPGCGSTIPNQTYFNGGLNGTAGLFICDNQNISWWSPPEWAILLAYHQVNDSTGYPIKVGNGQLLDNWKKPSLQNNFTNGTPNIQYRRVWPNKVHLHGIAVSGSTTGSGTTFVTMPSGYRPATALTVAIQNISSGANAWVGIDAATGGVAIHGAWANGNNFAINMEFPLDTV